MNKAIMYQRILFEYLLFNILKNLTNILAQYFTINSYFNFIVSQIILHSHKIIVFVRQIQSTYFHGNVKFTN
jgi:hypothetical protein